MRKHIPLLLFAAALGFAQTRPRDLTAVPIEELMQVEVTSPARKPQSLSRTAAAVTVITAEDIRRSGLSTVPELLRLAPGVQVARIDASRWAISARGFNGRMSNKVLVMVDGRSVYTSLYAGVYWDVQDLVPEDIERIEIIRGPGGTMWGANAVNGVINVVTRHASETVGGLVSATAGNQDQGVGSIRYGARLGSKAYARMTGRVANRGQFRLPDGAAAGDAWRLSRGSGRLDWETGPGRSLLVETDLFSTRAGEPELLPSLTPPYATPANDPTRDAGGSVLARWEAARERSDYSVEFSLSRLRHREARLGADMQTLELDFQQRLRRGAHELLWGGQVRRASDNLQNTAAAVFTPARYADPLLGTFVQDDWSLADNRLVLTAGAKLGHSGYTGFEIQPSARILWAPSEHRTAWAAVSRAVRTPARIDRDLWNIAGVTPGTPPTELVLFGNPRFQAEKLVSWEAGYRAEYAARVTLELAGFYNSYSDLRSLDVGTGTFLPSPARFVVPLQYSNCLSAASFGAELATKWQLAPRWRVDADYSWLNIRLDAADQPSELGRAMNGGNSPKHQARLQTYIDLTRRWQLDGGVFYVGRLAGLQVPGYVRTDARLGWRPAANLEISLAGQNLLDNRHPEFNAVYEGITRVVEVGRSAHVQLTWRF